MSKYNCSSASWVSSGSRCSSSQISSGSQSLCQRAVKRIGAGLFKERAAKAAVAGRFLAAVPPLDEQMSLTFVSAFFRLLLPLPSRFLAS